MNRETIDCRKVKCGVSGKQGGMEKEGDFCFSENFGTIYIWIPGEPGPDALHICKGASANHRIWGWDGDEEKPTLTPSINVPYHWHGHLTAGRLEVESGWLYRKDWSEGAIFWILFRTGVRTSEVAQVATELRQGDAQLFEDFPKVANQGLFNYLTLTAVPS
jgi:hypothetical protein